MAAELFDEPSDVAPLNKGFELSSAYQGQDALAMVQKSLAERKPFAMAYVDVRMPPGWDGIETVRHLWEVDKNLQVVICTAYSDYSWSEMVKVLGETDRLLILKKPFDNIEVRQITSSLTAKWNLAQKANHTMRELEAMVQEQTAELDTSNGQLRQEIAVRKRSEDALREAEARTRAIVDTAADGIITIDEFGVIESLNRAADRMFGYSHDQLIGQNIRRLMPEASIEAHDEGLANYRSTRKLRRPGTPLSLTAVRKDGSLFPVEVSLSVLTLADRTLFTGIVRDITEQKLLESQLIQAQKLESIGQLSAGIAHEINTPTQYVGHNTQFLQDAFGDLTSLLSRFDRMLEAAKSHELTDADIQQMEAEVKAADISYLVEEIPRAIAQSLDGVGRVAAIVAAMREFSHPGGDSKMAIDLNRSIESTAAVARNEWSAVAELRTEFDANLPPVHCLSAELNQVVLNLIVNAAHAIGEAQKESPRSFGPDYAAHSLQWRLGGNSSAGYRRRYCAGALIASV